VRTIGIEQRIFVVYIKGLKAMRTQLISTLLAALALIWAVPAADAVPLPEIRVEGNRFVDARGETIIFRGLNTSDPDKLEKAGRWNRRYFEEMAAWGANIARFPVHPTAWRSRGPEAYMQLLDQGIAWAGELGIYVIIDWHVIGNLRSGLFQNPMYETTFRETLEFWGIMANRYKDNSTVAFFELYNEPTTGGGRFGTCTWAQWREMLEEMIVVVRAYGSRAIPLVGGFNWAYDLTDVATDPVRAEGVAYVSHPYPMKRDKPWEPQWTADWGFVAEKYPLMLTEIGFCGPDDPGAHIPVISDESYGDAITKYCDERGISWVVWVFDPNWSPMLFSDWDFTPTRQGRYFKPALIERNKRN
jgi:endoglucanase